MKNKNNCIKTEYCTISQSAIFRWVQNSSKYKLNFFKSDILALNVSKSDIPTYTLQRTHSIEKTELSHRYFALILIVSNAAMGFVLLSYFSCIFDDLPYTLNNNFIHYLLESTGAGQANNNTI